MKAIYLDCFSGISGNMLLGAFIGAGVPADYLENELRKMPIADEFVFHVDDVNKNGIAAKYVDVELTAEAHEHEHHHDHDGLLEHAHEHEHHEHTHEHQLHEHEENVHVHGHLHEEVHAHEHQHHHAHQHRTMKDIRAMIEAANYKNSVKDTALQIFNIVAEAEGKVHGKPADEVNFHEVGATDSIVDIVGTAICLDYLGIEKVFASRLNVGGGKVFCAHGWMPVPAPATAEILKAWPVKTGGEKELTTPTGAAVVRALATYSDGVPQGFAAKQIAYGAGTWDLELPNVVRVYFGEYQEQAKKDLRLLEANIDDMNPQNFGYLFDALLQAGAKDVWTENIMMKKNRPAQKLSVLVAKEQQDDCTEIIFNETTTIGLRVLKVDERLEAERSFTPVQTPYGEVSCKISRWHGKIVNVSAEYEDCKRIAETKKVPLKAIREAAVYAYKKSQEDAK